MAVRKDSTGIGEGCDTLQCHAICGILGALDGLARDAQQHGSSRFSLDLAKKTWYTFANGKHNRAW